MQTNNTENKKLNILVVGGAGYIGSHCVKYLLDKGLNVFVLDNFSTGHKELIDKKAKIIEGDLLDKSKINEVFKANKFDAVMHFAAFSIVSESVKNPLKYYSNNIIGALNLLGAMVENKVDKIIFSSSAAVYGMPKNIPITEDDEKKPINTYGWTKLVIEQMLDDFSKAYGLRYVSLRYFNAAGSAFNLKEMHTPETHLIPVILNAAKQSGKIKIFGTDYNTKDGSAVRDYIHVLDLAEAHYLSLMHLANSKENKVYNLGSGRGYSVKEIISLCKRTTGIDFNVEESERRPGDPDVLIADYSKIEDELGWQPKYSLKEIISSAWESVK